MFFTALDLYCSTQHLNACVWDLSSFEVYGRHYWSVLSSFSSSSSPSLVCKYVHIDVNAAAAGFINSGARFPTTRPISVSFLWLSLRGGFYIVCLRTGGKTSTTCCIQALLWGCIAHLPSLGGFVGRISCTLDCGYYYCLREIEKPFRRLQFRLRDAVLYRASGHDICFETSSRQWHH